MNLDKLRTIRISVDKKVRNHISGAWNYASLCGLDGYDSNPNSLQKVITPHNITKITCKECYDLWKIAMKFKKSDFKV